MKYKSNMLKSVVLSVLVWHGMCEFSSRAQPYSTDTHIMNFTASVSPNIDDTDKDVEIEPKVNYYFNITIFNVNGSFFGTTALPTASTTASTKAATTTSTTASTTASTTTSTTASKSASTPASSKTCRQGYIVTNGIGAHRLYTTALTWSQARQICIEDGGDLAVIRSDAEDEIVNRMVINSGKINPWISFHSLPGKRHLACSITGTADLGDWISWNRHNPYKSDANYHVYDYNGTMKTSGSSCYTSRPFICKIPTI